MAQTKVELILELKERINSSLKKASDAVSSTTKEMRSKISQLKASWIGAFNSMRAEIPLLDNAIRLLTNPITLLIGGVAAVGKAFFSAGKSALEWEQGMAKINVTAQLSKKELANLSDEMLNIGRRNVAPIEEIPDAFSKIISAGLDANKSLEALEPTLRAAKAGFVDIETVATAGVNVMNSSGQDINTVYDVLFATLNKGAAEMGDIASYLPKIVPGAKQAGFALGETAGAFAFMTAQGQKSEAAATLLQNAFKSLSDPNKVANFNKIGVSVYDAQGKMLPLIDIVKQLSGSLTGLTDEQRAAKLKSLGLDQEAANAFAIMTQDVGKLSGIIDATSNSQGALNNAYKDSLTSTDNWKIALNNVQYILIRVGQLFMPVIKKIGEWAANFTTKLIPALATTKQFIADWSPVIYGVAAAFVVLKAGVIASATWTGILAAKTAVLTAAQWLLNLAMSANPIGIIIVAIGALIGAIVALKRNFVGWATLWDAIKTTLVKSFQQYIQTWKFGFTELWFNIQIFWTKLKGFGEYVGILFTNIGKSIKLALKGDFADAKEMLTQKITTKASVEVKELEAKRDANRQTYKSESAQRARDIANAWRSVNITKRKEEEQEKEEEKKDTATDGDSTTNTTLNTTDLTNGGGGGGLNTDSVVSSASAVRNITVNIDSFNKGGININGNQSGEQNMSASQLETWFNEMLLRTIRNLELSQ